MIVYGVSRMKREYLLTQAGAVDVYIYFGGGYVFVSEHLLDRPQVGTAFEQVSGERVAEGVW